MCQGRPLTPLLRRKNSCQNKKFFLEAIRRLKMDSIVGLVTTDSPFLTSRFKK
jgi:hypothetical protein